MEARCRAALIKSRQDLLKDLDVKPATDFLLSRFVITPSESNRVISNTSDYDKRRELLDTLPQKGPEAFDIFLEYLAENQFWLRDSINSSLATVTQEEVQKVQEEYQQLSIGGPTAQELQQALRHNINDFIRNDPSRILEEAEVANYINQPITAHMVERGKTPTKLPTENVFELRQNCLSAGQRVFVFGAGGMGKSSLCRHFAQTWVGEHPKLARFDYVFPIPMRAVRSRSIVDIICEDIELLPVSCKQRIEQELGLKSILFILDSFEELSFKTPELNRLIRRELFPKSSVIITARPGHNLEAEQSASVPCIKADLQDLTEEQVRGYMTNYPGLQEGVQLEIERRFGMGFLRKPVNLWLLCLLVAKIAMSADMPSSQTVLLNMLIQHLMLAYSKKKRLPEFSLTSESPMTNAPTEVKVMLEKVGQICYFGLKDKKRVLTIDDGVLSKADVMAMGLFSEGADDNSVTLPHPLFQEHLAALFLSVDKRARQDLLKELREESEGSSPRPSLVELLRPRGFDNMVRFLVGLSPGVAEGLSGLFVIRRSIHFYPLQVRLENDLDYELDLFRECSIEDGRSVIVAALLRAPVTMTNQVGMFSSGNTDSHLLFHYLDEEQRLQFLKKFYGCQICNNELTRAPASGKFDLDSFVVGMMSLHNCTVRLKHAVFRACQMPVSWLTDRLAAVEDLTLKCTLCDLTEAQFLASLNLLSLAHSSVAMPPRQREVLLSSVKLLDVKGLNLLSLPHCTLPTTRELAVTDKYGDVNLGSLCQCFTGVIKLRLYRSKSVHTDNAGKWSSVKEIWVHQSNRVDLISLKEMSERLEKLKLGFTASRVERRDADRHTQWRTVKYLQLWFSHLYTDERTLSEEEAREFLTQLCPEAEIDISNYGLPFFLED